MSTRSSPGSNRRRKKLPRVRRHIPHIADNLTPEETPGSVDSEHTTCEEPPTEIDPDLVCRNCGTNLHSLQTIVFAGSFAVICGECVGYCYRCDNPFFPHQIQPGPDGRICKECQQYTSHCLECNSVIWENSRNLCQGCRLPPTALPAKNFIYNPFKRFVGVEIEYLTREGMSFNDADIHEDGSVEPNAEHQYENYDEDDPPEDRYFGEEVAIHPSNGDRLLNIIKSVCSTLDNSNCYVNHSCGLHIHISTRGFNAQHLHNIRGWWSALEPIIFLFVEKSREENQYCEPISGIVPNAIRWSTNRYNSLNATARQKHGSYEVRIHEGTINYIQIKNWILFLLTFFEYFSQIDISTDHLDEVLSMGEREKLIFLFQQLPINLSFKKQLVRRIKQTRGSRGLKSLESSKRTA